MQEVSKAFEHDSTILFISHSVTPMIDSVARLNAYAKEHGINASQWHLITGNVEDIYALARQSYFVEEKIGFTRSNQEFLHTEHFLLIDKTKRIRGIYNGTLDLEIQQLIKDIEILKQEEV